VGCGRLQQGLNALFCGNFGVRGGVQKFVIECGVGSVTPPTPWIVSRSLSLQMNPGLNGGRKRQMPGVSSKPGTVII
jgi:hypothetical protein